MDDGEMHFIEEERKDNFSVVFDFSAYFLFFSPKPISLSLVF